jgi:hypothetical protein
MEDSSKTDGDLVDLVSSVNERLTALEEKVTKLSITQEQGTNEQAFTSSLMTTHEDTGTENSRKHLLKLFMSR